MIGNTATSKAQKERKSIIDNGGMQRLANLYPDEFEYYLCRLELRDSQDQTKSFFYFPVMPSSISESNNPIKNIKKTSSGVTVLKNDTFVPKDISLSGNFGRKFKTITSEGLHTAIVGEINLNTNGYFSETIKTGFGALKLLEKIIDRSELMDEYNKPHILIFTNLAWQTTYVVENMNIQFSQSQEQNIIWNYSLQFKAVMPFNHLDILNSVAMSLSTYRNTQNNLQQQRSSKLRKLIKQVANLPIPSNVKIPNDKLQRIQNSNPLFNTVLNYSTNFLHKI